MASLLLAEVAGSQLNDATARALTAALELGQPVDVLVAGKESLPGRGDFEESRRALLKRYRI